MYKKLFWICCVLFSLIFVVPTYAQTTGTNTNTGDFSIIIDPTTKQITVTMNTWTITTGTNTTGTTTTGNITTTGTTAIATTTTWTEFQQALAWMYANGLTMYNNETSYRPDDWLLREEAAKIIGQAFVVLGYAQTTKNNNCTFLDSVNIDPTLTSHVTNTCKRGIFKGTTEWNFLPREQLTRPQAMALLVRIFEGKISNESRTPRWGDYYLKGQAMGITTLNNQVAFDTSITRREIAIYIYRLKNIVSNETIKLMMLGKVSEINSTTGTTTTGILDNFWSLADSLSINNDPELFEAIRWMNDNGLTSTKTIVEYRPFEILNREQAAKIVTMFANIFWFTGQNTTTNCTFNDITSADASLVSYIQQACTLWIMNGSNGNFSPKWTITKSQFIAVIIRLFEGKKLDETTSPRWTRYFEKAQELGMVGPADAITFDNPITRYEVALFLYRFKIKHQILQNMNNNTIENQVISMVPGSTTTGANNKPQGNVYVDMNLLQNGNFEVGYIEIFGQRYKIVKSNTEKYFTNNFVRYGDIFALDTETKIGTTSFIVSNLSLIEGTIRIGEKTFTISPIANTKAYYKITQN